MNQPDMTEVRELRDRVKGLTADKATLEQQLAEAHKLLTASELECERITAHRNRLLAEKQHVWRDVLAPDEMPTITDPDPEC